MNDLQVGDLVVMNDKYAVSERNKGRVFEVRSTVATIGGTDCVWLEDYAGVYAVDGLTEITPRERAIYILQHLSDETFERLTDMLDKLEVHQKESADGSLNQFVGFYKLITGQISHLHGERVKGVR